MMQRLEEITLYANPDPLLVSRQAAFPGLVRMPDGELVAVFSIGQAFDAADMRAYVCRSNDDGTTWSLPVRLHGHETQPEESETLKPLLLRNGEMVATGYAFIRPSPLTPVVDPVTFEVLPLHNKISFSSDAGRTWTVPQTFDVEGQPLELSGPCIELRSGRILGAAGIFHLRKTGHAGWLIASDDGGRTWRKLSEFFHAPNGNIATFESRICEIAPDQVVVLFWAYDHAAGVNLTNHIVVSRDGGLSFEPACDTGIPAQASNLMVLGEDRLLTIHAHREAPVGLVVRRVDLSGEFRVEEELNLFGGDAIGSNSTDIRTQFGTLKFGQPSLLGLNGNEVLAACWKFEESQHVIKTYRIAL